MKKLHVQSVLAYIVVGLFMLVTGLMAVYPLLPNAKTVELRDYAQYFAQTASVYTGIVGVVIGYYFGRKEDEDSPTAKIKSPEHGSNDLNRAPLTPATTSPQPPLPPAP